MGNTHFVIIHGLASKPSKEKLQKRYERWLEFGAGRNIHFSRIHLAYWADLMGYAPDPPEADEYAEGRQNFESYSWTEQALFSLRGLARRGLVNSLETHLERTVGNAAQHQFGLSAMLRELPGFLAGPVARRVYEAQIKELHEYFFNGQREPVRDRLRKQLAAVPEESQVCLIAHSMGSIIAADLIIAGTRQIDTLVTIGSPLGLRVVKEQIGVSADTLASLGSKVGRWFNLYDRLDLVSLDSDLEDDYEPMPITDIRVRNEFVTKDGERNHHKSYGYLRCPEMGEIVAPLI